MKRLVMVALAVATTGQSHASTITLDFSGSGINGSLVLVYGATTDLKYPNAYEVTGISGTFSDSNNGLNIVDAPVGALVPITHDTPEPTNLLAPYDFSRFAVATGLPPVNSGFLTYDNLIWPGGSSQTASDYAPHGGLLDIYGLMFEIGGGMVVDFWSNGELGGPADYGVAVATVAQSLDYFATGVTASPSSSAPVPEPGSLWLLSSGVVGILAWRRRAMAA